MLFRSGDIRRRLVAAGDFARGWEWENSGPPLFEYLFEPGEQPDDDGENESVQPRHRPEPGSLIVGLGAQVGQEAGEGLGRDWRRGKHIS